jgi:peroxiredoxin
MKNFLKDRQELTTALLVLIVIVMMVQNYFLVRKNQDYSKRIERLSTELMATMVLSPGDSIQTFTALDLDSALVNLQFSNQKKPTLLFGFTTWCHACLENIPQWKSIEEKLAKDEIRIIGVCPDSVFKIKNYIAKTSLSLSAVSIVNDSLLADRLKLHSYPQTILIDREARVVRVMAGALSDDQMNDLCNLVKKSRVETQPAR